MNTPIYDELKSKQDAIKPWPPTGTTVIPSPELARKTFLRCLGWWKP